MSQVQALWRSAAGHDNSIGIQANYPDAFEAIAEIDALGHRMLKRASDEKIVAIDRLVGLAIMRRAVTLFVGIRHLFEASAVEAAKLPLRALFETLLAMRYLVHGGKRRVGLLTPSYASKREARARYFFVAAERRGVYRRQSMLDGRWGGERVTGADRKRLKDETASEIARLAKDYPT